MYRIVFSQDTHSEKHRDRQTDRERQREPERAAERGGEGGGGRETFRFCGLSRFALLAGDTLEISALAGNFYDIFWISWIFLPAGALCDAARAR